MNLRISINDRINVEYVMLSAGYEKPVKNPLRGKTGNVGLVQCSTAWAPRLVLKIV